MWVGEDEERRALLRAVEQVAGLLTDGGMPRMAARVFAYALADDSERYTAADLAEGLQVSAAAISGAVRYLVMTHLLVREREPGTRADLYRIHHDDVWGAITMARIPMLEQWEAAVHKAAAEIGDDHRGARRLRETEEFFRFSREDMAAMVERWREHRATLK